MGKVIPFFWKGEINPKKHIQKLDYKFRPNGELKPDKRKRFYYHITHKRWGDKLLLEPVSGNTGNRAWNEPTNLRTCVAPSIAHCLAAITYSSADKPYNVYRTENPVIAYWPYKVDDASVTRERWIITSEVFVHIGTLDIEPFIFSKEVSGEFSLNSETGCKEALPELRQILKAWKKALKNNHCEGLVINEL